MTSLFVKIITKNDKEGAKEDQNQSLCTLKYKADQHRFSKKTHSGGRFAKKR